LGIKELGVLEEDVVFANTSAALAATDADREDDSTLRDNGDAKKEGGTNAWPKANVNARTESFMIVKAFVVAQMVPIPTFKDTFLSPWDRGDVERNLENFRG
jgi:hypothetical protein